MFVIAFVTPRLTPCRMKNVARVTMKLGSLVFWTMNPFRKPTAPAATSVRTIAGHTFRFSSVARMPIISPELPVMTPAERSNSPPIMSRATATAGMPSVEATSVQLAMPSSVMNSDVVTVKNTATAIAASAAPSSGRRSSLVARLTCASRSSTTSVAGTGASSTVAPLIACPPPTASTPWPRSTCRRSPGR